MRQIFCFCCLTGFIDLMAEVSSSCIESVCTSSESEIAALKNIYPKCKIISKQGDFLHIITIHPILLHDLRIIFQLTDQYPKQPPEIIIISQSMTDQDQNALHDLLCQKATSLIGSYMVNSLVKLAVDWLASNINIKEISSQKDTKDSEFIKKPLTHLKKCKKLDVELEKLPSMKTADNVVNRLLWDESLPRELFTIGYVDRFEGVMEKPFCLFNWEDIASVDYDVLAIPKHRINYFKYRNAKVWDKNERLDIIFGSTGSDTTIQEFIHNYDLEFGEPVIENVIKINLNDDSDSEDESPVVHFDNKDRPNYFLSVRITNLNIITEALKIQSYIKENEPRLIENCISAPAMHVTLGVLKLDSPADVAEAVSILNTAPLKLAKYFEEPLILTFEGVDNFRNSVLYVKIKPNDQFLKFVDEMLSMLKKFLVNTFDYVPHLTLVKVSRPVAREMRSSFINPFWYQNFKNTHFGDEQIKSVFLCSIKADKRDDGFYVTTSDVNFVTDEVD